MISSIGTGQSLLRMSSHKDCDVENTISNRRTFAYPYFLVRSAAFGESLKHAVNCSHCQFFFIKYKSTEKRREVGDKVLIIIKPIDNFVQDLQVH